jgi:hypothetical protein
MTGKAIDITLYTLYVLGGLSLVLSLAAFLSLFLLP